VSCTVHWRNGKTASATWSGAFDLVYGDACDSKHPFIGHQVASCSVTRTTEVGGNTRTITNPAGDVEAVDHDSNGADTGYDKTVSPAPTNDGVIAACDSSANGCADGLTLVISGSHITGTVDVGGKKSGRWDHTVSTGDGGIVVAGSGENRVVNGSVYVQHNLAQETTLTVFKDVTYGDPACCFPRAAR